MRMANDQGLDLIEIVPQSNPPVCRIMSYDKLRYEMRKKDKESRKKQRRHELKEIWLRPHIDPHDVQFKVKRAAEFLTQGNKVKITVRFRGREMARQEFGRKLIERFIQEIGNVASLEAAPKLEGRHLIVVLAPKGHG